MPKTTGHPRWWVAGFSVLVLLAVAGITWSVVGGEDQPYEVDLGAPAAAEADASGAADVLRRLARAWTHADRDEAAALGTEGTSVTTVLAAAADTVDHARITDVSLRYLDELGGVDESGQWPAAVEVTWRYAGFDPTVSRTEVAFSFHVDGDDVEVAAVGGQGLAEPIWLTGPLAITRTPDLLVLVAGTRDPAPYVQLARNAGPAVRTVVPRGRQPLVVEVPDGQAALESALASQPGYYAQIAAVTTSPDGVNAPGSPVHVFVNPDVFDALDADGKQVVLTHEVVHVVTLAPRSRAPIWLVEGFADYVALRDTDLPLSRTAAQIRARVAQDGLPQGLPAPADFNTQGPHLGAVYEAAWLLCVTLADQGGEEALVRFYRAMSNGATLDVALDSRFGWSENDLLTAWQDRLSHLPA